MNNNNNSSNGTYLEKIVLILIGIAIGLALVFLFLELSGFIGYVKDTSNTNKEILSILKSDNTCDLPYGLQDKIEETYENIVSFNCVTKQ